MDHHQQQLHVAGAPPGGGPFAPPPPSVPPPTKRFDPAALSVGAVFLNESGKGTTALSFHRLGGHLVSCGGDGSVRLIDAVAGASRKVVHCKKYGVGAACFTHHETSVLHAGSGENVSTTASSSSSSLSAPGASSASFSSPESWAIRYLALYDNKYLRTFRGHDARVSCLAMHPASDEFLSCGEDGIVASWHLGSAQTGAAAVLDLKREAGLMPYAVEYFRDGLVFAVAGRSTTLTSEKTTLTSANKRDNNTPVSSAFGAIKLFDARNYSAGPFATMPLRKSHVASAVCDRDVNTPSTTSFAGVDSPSTSSLPTLLADRLGRAKFSGLEASPDGEYLLVKTDCCAHLVYDSFDGRPLFVLWDDDATYATGRGARAVACDSGSTGAGDAAALRNTTSSSSSRGGIPNNARGTTTSSSNSNQLDDQGDPPSTSDATFGPRSDCVLGGGDDGLMRVWRLPPRPQCREGAPEAEWPAPIALPRPHALLECHACPLRHLKFSPTLDLLASACANTCLWLPP